MHFRRFMLLFVLIALITYHFVLAAGAAGPSPGTARDPLVTKSYVDRYLAQTMGEIKEQLAYLRGQVRQISQRVSRLEARLGEPVVLTIGDNLARRGEEVLPLAQAPYIKEGRTMLPFRFIGELMEAEVAWDGSLKQVTFRKDGQIVRLTIGAKEAVINGTVVPLDAPPELKNGTTMVPLRFVTEGLGARVQWLPETKQVILRP